MNTIVVVGASGYIGRYLIAELVRVENARVKVLSRPVRPGAERASFPSKVEVVEGDLFDAASLKQLCEPGCVVIHLAYLWDGGETQNLTAIANLMDACEAVKVRRLIHLSTAMVAGRNNSQRISETDVCVPVTEYAQTKLKIEEKILNRTAHSYDAVILRPTAVFGPGSENLKKLAGDLLAGSRFRNYLKSCLFNKRRMNLVQIANVVGAIIFLQQVQADLNGEVFIISDADIAQNNFRDVERLLMKEMGIPDYGLPRLNMPTAILGGLLSIMGKDNINPRSDYVSTKLDQFGFKKNMDFERAVSDYAASYRLSMQQ